MCSPQTFETLLQYVHDTTELLTVENMGKMLLLDNWNEYGEGHFMMPTDMYGFGYLDAVRNVFVGKDSHTDSRPSENEKKHLGKLYSDWLQPMSHGQISVTVRDDEDHILKEWSGSSGLQKWKNKGGDMTTLTLGNDGILTGESTGDDPIISCSEDLSNLSMINVNYVE